MSTTVIPLPRVSSRCPRCTSASEERTCSWWGVPGLRAVRPRPSFAGTYDQTWQHKRAPYLPLDFDSRFFQCACPEMTFDRYLQGTEPLEVRGATPDAPITLTLPVANLDVEVKVAGAAEHPT